MKYLLKARIVPAFGNLNRAALAANLSRLNEVKEVPLLKVPLLSAVFAAVLIFSMAALTLTGCPNSEADPATTEDNTPTVTQVTVHGDTVVEKGGTKQFSAEVTGMNNPAKTVGWSIVETNKHASTTINTSGLLTVAADETLTKLTVKATSTVDGKKYGTREVTVYAPGAVPTVTSVTVNPQTATVVKGNTLQFSAAVAGTNNPAQTVDWSIVETHKHTGTAITTSGLLTVAAAETLTKVTVKATSTVDGTKSGTREVTITAPAGSNPPATPQAFRDITATELVSEMKIGWNLGNSLDANDDEAAPGSLANKTVAELEKLWTNHITTKANIDAIKNAGFNTIRIPVSWTKATNGAPNYTIRADWMARVVEVVNYAVDNDMYILLDTHHDETVFTFMNSNAAAGQAAYKKIWEQIADTFKNYNEKLIFEGLNEPRTIGSAAEWGGGTAEERNNLNAYYPIFVNAVRNSGGNNAKRILMINTYAASIEQVAVDGLTLPTDPGNRLIVSVHAYQPWYFCYVMGENKSTWSIDDPSDKSAVMTPIDRVYNKFVANNIPVIIGEFGAQDKNGNLSARAAWAEFYVSYALSKGIKCVVWDNGVTTKEYEGAELFGLFNRTTNVFDNTMKEALMRGAETPYGSSGGGEQEELGTLFGFSWKTNKNSASSFTTASTSGGKITITGTLSDVIGDNYAELQGAPNPATSTALKTMTQLKLSVQGDGNSYRVSLPTTDTASSYNHWGYTFNTTSSGTTTVTINMPGDLTPSWGSDSGSIIQDHITGIQFGATNTGAFNLTITNIEIEGGEGAPHDWGFLGEPGYQLGDGDVAGAESQMAFTVSGANFTAFKNASKIVLNFGNPVAGGLQIIWQGLPSYTGWHQTAICEGVGTITATAGASTLSADKKTLTVDLSALESYASETGIQFIIAYYSGTTKAHELNYQSSSLQN